MRKAYCAIIFSFLFLSASAQEVARISGKPVSSKAFIWFYKRNHNGNGNASYRQLEDYLNLYLNFKLKVLDALEMGFDKDTAYINEVSNYEKALRGRKRTAAKNETYTMIMNEYRDAVLMFNISEIKVWDKAQNDEAQLRTFYQQHKTDYADAPFEEVRGKVISDYQQQLEHNWVASLRAKYTVEVYPETLRKLAKL